MLSTALDSGVRGAQSELGRQCEIPWGTDSCDGVSVVLKGFRKDLSCLAMEAGALSHTPQFLSVGVWVLVPQLRGGRRRKDDPGRSLLGNTKTALATSLTKYLSSGNATIEKNELGSLTYKSMSKVRTSSFAKALC